MASFEFRNPKYSAPDNSTIDMEVNHPMFGWIPFTTTPEGPEPYYKELWDAAIATGNVAPYVPLAQPQ